MELAHDVAHALTVVVALANTSPRTAGAEALPDVAALEELLREQGVTEVGEMSDADLAATRRVRETLVRAMVETDPSAAVSLINELLAQGHTAPRLTRHGDFDWHLHYSLPGTAQGRRVAAESAMALAHVLTADEWTRIATCAAPDCRRLLVDLSRNRSRRYCNAQTCGNRLHVAAYRERRRAAVG